jgi:hypothetical protein
LRYCISESFVISQKKIKKVEGTVLPTATAATATATTAATPAPTREAEAAEETVTEAEAAEVPMEAAAPEGMCLGCC